MEAMVVVVPSDFMMISRLNLYIDPRLGHLKYISNICFIT